MSIYFLDQPEEFRREFFSFFSDMCITNKRFSEEQENEFIEYTDTTWKTDKEKTDPNDNFFNLLFSENDGLIILFLSLKFFFFFFYCWKNEGLCKT